MTENGQRAKRRAAVGEAPPLHPFLLRKRLRGPGRQRLGDVFALPRRDHLFELRVSAWLAARPPPWHDKYLQPFNAEEVRLARRLALQLRVRFSEPLTGLARDLATRARWLRAAQRGGRRGVAVWLLEVEALPRAEWRRARERLRKERLRRWREHRCPARRSAPPFPGSDGPGTGGA